MRWMWLCPPFHHCPHVTPAKPQASLGDRNHIASEEFQIGRPKESLGCSGVPEWHLGAKRAHLPFMPSCPAPGPGLESQMLPRQQKGSWGKSALWMLFGKQIEQGQGGKRGARAILSANPMQAGWQYVGPCLPKSQDSCGPQAELGTPLESPQKTPSNQQSCKGVMTQGSHDPRVSWSKGVTTQGSHDLRVS